MTFSAAAWSTIDALVAAARTVDADARAAWLDARRLRPEVRAYVEAMAAGPVDLAPPQPPARAAHPRPIAPARPDAPPPRPHPSGEAAGARRARARADPRRGALLAGAAASLALLGLAAARRRAVAAR